MDLMTIDTFELLEELSNRRKEDVRFAILRLLLEKKIDFTDLSQAYVKSLEINNEDKLNQLIEAETCVLESFIHKAGGKSEDDRKSTQRRLYLLNKSRRFNMDSLNKKYHYNEEEAKKYSWYEKEKEWGME